MRNINRKLKKFEQFDPESDVMEAQPEVAIDKERLNKLITIAVPILDEISTIISEDETRVVSIEYRNRIGTAMDALEELKEMFQ
jgi:hypothetical protein